MYKLILPLLVFSFFTTKFAMAESVSKIPQGDLTLLIFSETEKIQDPLYSFIQPQIEDAATQQAQIWGDTILEGDYVSDGNTHVDEVFAVYKDNILQAYKFTYSEKAWMIANCDYTGDDNKGLNDCLQGRIVESSYTSPDFKQLEPDQFHRAEFHQN